MFCPNCGKEIPEGYSFCGNCGASVLEYTQEYFEDGDSVRSATTDSGMFQDIGQKIKNYAKVLMALGVIFSILFGVLLWSFFGNLEDVRFIFVGFLLGALVAALGILGTYLTVMVLYAFGELVDTNAEIARNTRRQ